MIVRRWLAPLVPSPEQIKMMLVAEGLEPYEELYPAGAEVKDHRHPFDEIRVVAAGELFVNIA
ncbi:MAG: cupin domain-containing protein, partial [Bdellovibrionales bacterium]|nr:cupin domain-containing protein [Bdellovibrionales bacterium]